MSTSGLDLSGGEDAGEGAPDVGGESYSEFPDE